jgi:hypothetical protein
MAGIKRLINQIPNVVPIIPIVLTLYKFNSSVLNLPLMPRSAIANDGTIASTRNSILITQNASTQEIFTSNT